MRNTVLAVIFLTAVVGCAREASAPISPPLEGLSQAVLAQEPDDNHQLWGEWLFVIDSVNERVDVVPRREARFHLNALKFLESYCQNCLQITGIKNNGDSTIDLTVQITHPFNGFPQYTGFDVKGIIMFNGSYEYPNHDQDDDVDHKGWTHLPNPYFSVSWRLMGDPELLNADGYTPRWSPQYDSGSDLPIFNYWKGKFASEGPFADLNAFLNFYSQEERHMFSVNSSVSRTYKIWLPPGQPVIAGYAVEACWEPPSVMPVTNPLEDFPVTANQTEAYRFHTIVNNGEVITDCSQCCGYGDNGCHDLRTDLGFYKAIWDGEEFDTQDHYPWLISMVFPPDGVSGFGDILTLCPNSESYFPHFIPIDPCDWGHHYGNGPVRFVAYNAEGTRKYVAYDVWGYTVNDPNY
jgi:hypothetical protein